MGKRYKPNLVIVTPLDTRRASWTMGRRPVSGEEHIFKVEDENYSKLNEWTFVVRVPAGSSTSIIVQPTQVPGKRVWAGVERRSIVWRPATINPHRKKMYCKLNLADPTLEKTKVGLTRGERGLLPKWFKSLKHRIRLKGTVTTTRGTDAKAQVLLVRKRDYVGMIRLFFALKVWVLEEGYWIETY